MLLCFFVRAEKMKERNEFASLFHFLLLLAIKSEPAEQNSDYYFSSANEAVNSWARL